MKIGVYGLGRFGVFWAQKLSLVFGVTQIYGYSRTHKDDLPPCISQVDFVTLCNCDVIVLCVAISAIKESILKLVPYIKNDTVVMDTCSVKVYPVNIMEKMLPNNVHIIGTHPMFGPDSGKDGIEGLPIVFSPVRCPDEIIKKWKEIFSEQLKLSLIEMTPEEHDKEAAVTQGITHFVGRVLKEMNLKESKIGTLGYTKLLEIIQQTCNDPLQLFIDLQRLNPYTDDMRKRLLNAMEHQVSMVSIKED